MFKTFQLRRTTQSLAVELFCSTHPMWWRRNAWHGTAKCKLECISFHAYGFSPVSMCCRSMPNRLVNCCRGLIFNVRKTPKVGYVGCVKHTDAVSLNEAPIRTSSCVCCALMSVAKQFMKRKIIHLCHRGRCTCAQGMTAGSHTFALVVKIILYWPRCAAHLLAAFSSAAALWTFLCNCFSSLKSSWTLHSRAIGHAVLYILLYSLVQCRLRRSDMDVRMAKNGQWSYFSLSLYSKINKSCASVSWIMPNISVVCGSFVSFRTYDWRST